MALVDVPSSFHSCVVPWILFQRERQRLPSMEIATPFVLDNRLELFHNVVENLPLLPHLKQFGMPCVLINNEIGEGWRIGSAWILKNIGGNIERFVPLEVKSLMRFAIYEGADGRCRAITSVELGDNLLGFHKASEIDGEKILNTFGIMNSYTGTIISSFDIVAHKSCPFCAASDRVCDCGNGLMKEFFETERKLRLKACRQSANVMGTACVEYAHSWLKGSWTFRANGDFIASCRAKFCFSMDTVQSPVSCVLQSEMDELLKPSRGLTSAEESRLALPSLPSEDKNENILMGMRPEKVEKSSTKGYHCPICNVNIRRKFDLQRHIRCVHEGKREHQCSLCLQSFTQRGHLNVHIKTTHEGSSDFKCTVCGKTFGLRSKLTRHTTTVHTNHRSFACMHCSNRYKNSHSLKEHILKRHPSEL